jgi:hypothetical protein
MNPRETYIEKWEKTLSAFYFGTEEVLEFQRLFKLGITTNPYGFEDFQIGEL